MRRVRIVAIIALVYVGIALVWWTLAPGTAEWTPLRLNWPAHAYRWVRSNMGSP